MSTIRGQVISCKGLKNVDLFGKCDPFIMMQLIDAGGKIYEEAHTSSMIDELDPTWEDEKFAFCTESADIMGMYVLFKVMDEGLGPDEELGSARVPLKLIPVVEEDEEPTVFNFSLGVVKGRKPAGMITVALGLVPKPGSFD